MTALVRGYVVAADLGKRGACHLFRHHADSRIMPTSA
jgi:hypothetical protein